MIKKRETNYRQKQGLLKSDLTDNLITDVFAQMIPLGSFLVYILDLITIHIFIFKIQYGLHLKINSKVLQIFFYYRKVVGIVKYMEKKNKLEHNIEPDNIYHDDDEKIDNTISLIDH
uniref:Uncharacterized protein n=1 Tax=Rhizophagus irregularis (strain DAOM 181602 / DAOM 197198 / MUCL 43194) TaxID=747089 RepID=U9UR18_RHIID